MSNGTHILLRVDVETTNVAKVSCFCEKKIRRRRKICSN